MITTQSQTIAFKVYHWLQIMQVFFFLKVKKQPTEMF